MVQIYFGIILTLLMKSGFCNNEDLFNMTMEFLHQSAHSLETHIVTTEDGYLLTIHRIPGPPGAAPIFFQHGIIGSSNNWLLTQNDSLAYMFANLNHDVWLGNSRSSAYSKSHNVYNVSDDRFWNFSFHEIGTKDLPAMIDYVANYTRQKVVFIGFSMGTTAFFVMGSENQEASSNIKIAFTLAPVAFTDNLKIPNLKFLFKYTWVSSLIFGKKSLESKIGHSGMILSYAKQKLYFKFSHCKKTHIKSLNLTVFRLHIESGKMNLSTSPNQNYLSHILSQKGSTTSVKTIRHFAQQSRTGKFQQFDYGSGNLVIYNSTIPPEYNLSQIQIPVVLFVSEGDVLATTNDVESLWNKLPNIYKKVIVTNREFCHLDFIYGYNAKEYVYNNVIDTLRKFEKEQKTV